MKDSHRLPVLQGPNGASSNIFMQTHGGKGSGRNLHRPFAFKGANTDKALNSPLSSLETHVLQNIVN